MIMSATATADVISCGGKDLSFSLERSRQQSMFSTSYPERAELTVTCLGQKPLIFISYGIIEPSKTDPSSYSADGYLYSISSNISAFVKSLFDSSESQHREALLKSYLATLLTAKTSNLVVELKFDPKSGLNYTDGRFTILAIGVK
jgi:hypothetical protein